MFFPVRLLATVYVDLFRALPGLLVIFMLGFGIPALGIAGVPVDPFFWGVVTLTLLYSAYVSEVYRAGIDSVHPSQEAAARSLGLTRSQSLRHVVLPQAVRRVIPPLLNDFIGLQKDTVLISFIGVVEIFRTAQIKQMATFNFTPYVAVALVFIVVTFPLARVVDWLVARDRSRAAGGRAMTGARRPRGAPDRGAAQVVRRPRGPPRHRPRRGRARGRLPDRRLGLRQVDAAALHQPPRGDRRRADRRRAARRSPRRRSTSTGSGAGSASCSRPSTCSRT